MQVGQVTRFEVFLNFASRLVPDGWVGMKSSSDRCHFWAFQLELDILGTKNIEIRSVVTKLQALEVGRISENPEKSPAFLSKIEAKSSLLCSGSVTYAASN